MGELAKYIVTHTEGKRVMHVFDLMTNHADYAREHELKHMMSAGFIKQEDWCNDGKPYAGGYSQTLGIHAEAGDDELLEDLIKSGRFSP